MKKTIILIFLIFGLSAQAQIDSLKSPVIWNGYTQVRTYSNFDDNTGFMVRRMKLWIKSSPDFSEHWSYKIQAIITSFMQEKFFLQDVKLTYKTGLFSFDFGQFIPAYSLQWSQPDWKIPTIERAKAVDAISPNGSLGVRDIGLQANYITKNKLFETHAGVFNGYGIKQYRFDNNGYMITHKSNLNIPINKSKIIFGYSALFRKAKNLIIPKVLVDNEAFTGNDLRFNIFVRFENKHFDLQSEYLYANLENQISQGYYFLTSIKINTKNQLVFSYEDYDDLIAETIDNPRLHLGYNVLFNQNKLMLFFDNSLQFQNQKIENYIASVQLQIFFN